MNLKYLLKVLLTPSCWMQNHKYSKVWDAKLKKLMLEHKFIRHTERTTNLGGHVLWVAGIPYSCFYPYKDSELEYRPSRTTIMMAVEKLHEDYINEEVNK